MCGFLFNCFYIKQFIITSTTKAFKSKLIFIVIILANIFIRSLTYRAITKDDDELYCWDFKDIKNPKKLFSAKNPGTMVRGPNRYF